MPIFQNVMEVMNHLYSPKYCYEENIDFFISKIFTAKLKLVHKLIFL